MFNFIFLLTTFFSITLKIYISTKILYFKFSSIKKKKVNVTLSDFPNLSYLTVRR